jgi:wyosine [tRNA(Phe)-imidazoG37] synthetase (radical SAM superfamily)
MLLPLQRAIVYGPVHSRRLGRSLGINLLPASAKACTFDCLYCQYGWTPAEPEAPPARSALPAVEAVLAAVGDALAALPEPPAFLTFSGNGEATLHPDFPEIVAGVTALRDRLAPSTRTAVLSNSTRLHDPGVRGALARLDVRIMKLDAGTEETFRRVNRPFGGTTLASVLAGLASLGGVTVQTLFAEGPAGNAEPGEIRAWIENVVALRPEAVQLYTLDRGCPCDEIGPVGRRLLETIRDVLISAGVAAEAY